LKGGFDELAKQVKEPPEMKARGDGDKVKLPQSPGDISQAQEKEKTPKDTGELAFTEKQLNEAVRGVIKSMKVQRVETPRPPMVVKKGENQEVDIQKLDFSNPDNIGTNTKILMKAVREKKAPMHEILEAVNKPMRRNPMAIPKGVIGND